MGFFDSVGAAAKAVWQGAKNIGETAVRGVEKAVGWVNDLFTGNLGAQAMPIPEILKKVEAGKGTGDWHQGAAKAAELADQHHDIGNQIASVRSTLESVWTGSASEAAQARLKPLVDVTNAAAATFTANSSNVTGMAYEFDHMKRAMAEDKLPPTPPQKNFWDVATPWSTDTEAKINAYNAAIERNLARYNTYAQQAGTSGQQLKSDYGQLGTFGDGKIKIVGEGKRPEPGDKRRREPVSKPGIDDLEKSGKDDSGGLEDRERTPEHDSRTDRDHTSFGDRTRPERLSGDGPGETRAAAHTPVSSGGSAGAGYSSGVGGFGATGGHAGAEERSTGPGVGRVGAGALGAGGRGTGAGSSRYGAAGGRAGVPGATGMGGLGAGRGQGEDDGEHRRKYGVPDDAAFGEAETDDGYLVDPATGLRVVPPTIGEG